MIARRRRRSVEAGGFARFVRRRASGWNIPEPSASASVRIAWTAALISARWVKAYGKLPGCRPVRGSVSPARRCSGLAEAGSRSHNRLARATSPISTGADASRAATRRRIQPRFQRVPDGSCGGDGSVGGFGVQHRADIVDCRLARRPRFARSGDHPRRLANFGACSGSGPMAIR